MPETFNTLADLFAPVSAEPPWSPADLASIWRHQLASALADNEPGGAFAALSPNDVPPRATFAEVLHANAPSLAALTAIKNFGKSILTRHADTLPADIASALYFLSILAARRRLNRHISRLDDAALQHAILWLNAQDWLDPLSRQLAALP